MSNHLRGCVIAVVVLSFLLPSCFSTRQTTYMQGSFDTAALSQIKIPEAVIRPGDLLSIIVYSDNPEATALFNQSVITIGTNTGASGSGGAGGAGGGGGTGSNAGALGAGNPTTPGYQVDEDGNIQFQGLGILHVEGLTKAQLKDTLDSRLKDTYLNNPYYTIRFLNYRFTMLGEVQHPGIFSIPGEHISMLEAIGLAGDLTLYGRRDNVLVIRENEGKRAWARLDLTKPQIMSSPFFYLQQNDVVYIEATKKKLEANDQSTIRTVTIAATVISTIAIILTLLKK
ncbi:MAG TPA: polysaccharide biosynthesis/export family protein [Puia sp.]|nr:polysaccharide biosynthesis/export family protein [Puia sp.]